MVSRLVLVKIISGGQSGVDQAALRAAKRLGLQTGGWMPKGWRTENGPRPDIGSRYGMTEHESSDYRKRTFQNVFDGDGTLIMGWPTSPGCKLTARYCLDQNKPRLTVTPECAFPDGTIRRWLRSMRIRVLNVAGNREESYPKIGKWAEDLLVKALAEDLVE